MKKIFLLLLLFTIGFGRGICQLDTIHYPLPHYHRTAHWTEDTIYLTSRCDLWYHYYNYNAQGEMAKACYTKDSLRIYGVAGAWFIPSTEYDRGRPINRENWKYLDTALDHVYEYYKVLKYDGMGGMDELASTKVYATDPPVAYIRYMPADPYTGERFIPRRILEAYFDEPVTVIDTFYVGCTQYMDMCDIIDGVQWWRNRIMYDVTVSQWGYPEIPFEEQDLVYERSNYYNWYSYRSMRVVFPIFNPEEVVHDGVEKPTGLARFVSLSPNPANDKARVVSSFPLKSVEVYDMAGKVIYVQAASGSSSWLEVSSWPTGTYMVKVNTTMGEVTKKLQVY